MAESSKTDGDRATGSLHERSATAHVFISVFPGGGRQDGFGSVLETARVESKKEICVRR